MNMKCFFGAGLILAFSCMHGVAADFKAGNLVITDPWAPPGLGQQRIGAVYFGIRNQGQEPDRLQSADLPDGGNAMLHISKMQDGVMHMRMMGALEIPAGGEAVLQPGAMHVMLTDLPAPLPRDGEVRLILHFEKAGQVEVRAAIRPRPASQAQPPAHMEH